MIEANENIDLVTMRRQQQLSRAKASYQRGVSEGRLLVQSRQGGASADGRTAPVSADHVGAGGQVATGAPLQDVTTGATIPVETAPADPEAAWRYTRLAITAGLVVLLFVVWIWQKRAGR